MTSPSEAKPPLADLVLAGNQQKEAVRITDFIFMAKDISNAYLVTTAAGDVMVNTGFMDNAQRTKALLAPHRTARLRYIVLTQAHADHYGGVPAMREPGTQVIGERRFVDTWHYFNDLAPYLGRRSRKLWGSTIKRAANPPPPPEVVPEITVDRQYRFDLGGRDFEVISTPGGETLDSLVLWMPKERVVFTGNLFGPVFLSMPNLCTVRGDKPRSVQRYLRSLDAVRNLGAELLITGHGEPIRGAATIRADLDKMHAAVSYVNEATIAGMNAGKTCTRSCARSNCRASSRSASSMAKSPGTCARSGRNIRAGSTMTPPRPCTACRARASMPISWSSPAVRASWRGVPARS